MAICVTWVQSSIAQRAFCVPAKDPTDEAPEHWHNDTTQSQAARGTLSSQAIRNAGQLYSIAKHTASAWLIGWSMNPISSQSESLDW